MVATARNHLDDVVELSPPTVPLAGERGRIRERHRLNAWTFLRLDRAR